MIISTEQKQNLHNYLNEIFTYRETLSEVYDHILSAAEQYQGELPFQEVVTHIIQYDFGGSQKLVDLEKAYKQSANEEIWGEFKVIFFKNLRSTGLFLTLICAIFIFYLKVNIIYPPVLFVVVGLYFLASIGDWFYRPFRSGYLGQGKKESVKDKILTNLLNFPGRFTGLIFGLLATRIKSLEPASILGILIILVVYILLPVFIQSYYQAFKKEYELKFNPLK